jgi:hypothetical protein
MFYAVRPLSTPFLVAAENADYEDENNDNKVNKAVADFHNKSLLNV